MFKKILLVVILLIAGLLVTVSFQPSSYAVERTATIGAPPASVFAEVNDLAAWDHWSPWKEKDPAAKGTMSTPTSGKGAWMTWDGNDDVGAGKMTILDSKPTERIDLELAFLKPMEGKSKTIFTFAPAGTPDGSSTKVTWRMEGENNFIGKAFCLFMDMDKMIGGDFDRGFELMKNHFGAGTPANK